MDNSKVIKFLEKDPETWEIHFGDKYHMTVDHDMHGWAGIELAKNILEDVAAYTGIEFYEGCVEDLDEVDLSETLYDRNGKAVIIGKDGKIVARQG